APATWSAPDSTLLGALAWTRLAPGLEWATARLACAAPTWRSKLIVARLDPRLLRLTLDLDMTRDMHPGWTIDRAPNDAVLAVNAGQFVGSMPWGWVVRDGRQLFGSGPGPLASAIAIDGAGAIRWAHGDSLPPAAGAAVAFQSFPTLL